MYSMNADSDRMSDRTCLYTVGGDSDDGNNISNNRM